MKNLNALNLTDPRWSELQHAYGAAADIPHLLEQLVELPSSEGDREPWLSLWSALAHQGDVYSASFAAVPHVIQALASNPLKASFTYFHFPAWVEICRNKKNIQIPEDLKLAYFQSLLRLPSLIAAASSREWDDDMLACVLAALAAAKGKPRVAEAALELTSEVAIEFMEWFVER